MPPRHVDVRFDCNSPILIIIAVTNADTNMENLETSYK